MDIFFRHRMIDERVVVGIKKGRSIFTLHLWKNEWNVAKDTFIWDTMQNLLSIFFFLQALPRVRSGAPNKNSNHSNDVDCCTCCTLYLVTIGFLLYYYLLPYSSLPYSPDFQSSHTRMWWCGSYFNSFRKRFGHG